MSSDPIDVRMAVVDDGVDAITVHGVSKNYQIYARPQDRLKQAFMGRVRQLLRLEARHYFRNFWALRNVGFTVGRGETVGIIGRNGSGKSTLLQIIAGTLSPSDGQVRVHGRVAALLELGAGFNPEFTGRENVFLNGKLLGLTHEQLIERYDSIAEFAGIGDFINQPIKTYSSGMVVRLAFAVLAHCDPDILIIDEALAVGDAVFTQRCMRFLRRFRQTGTVLFVSHDAAAVLSLCSRAIWLEHGEVRLAGSAAAVAEAYMQHCAQETAGDEHVLESLQGASSATPVADDATQVSFFDNIADSEGWTTDVARIESVELRRTDGRAVRIAAGGEALELTVMARVDAALDQPIIGFFVKDRLGQALFGTNTYEDGNAPVNVDPGDRLEARFRFKLPMLPNGTYSMTVAIADGDIDDHVQHHWMHDAVILRVQSSRRRYGLVGIPFDLVALHRVASTG